jgi:hypothetical protein
MKPLVVQFRGAEMKRCGSFGGCKRKATTPYKVVVEGPLLDSKGKRTGKTIAGVLEGYACAKCADRHISIDPGIRPWAQETEDGQIKCYLGFSPQMGQLLREET